MMESCDMLQKSSLKLQYMHDGIMRQVAENVFAHSFQNPVDYQVVVHSNESNPQMLLISCNKIRI